MSLSNNNHNQSNVHSGTNKSSKKTKTAVGLLMKQKRYVANEKFRKSDFVLLQNKSNFVLQKMIESDLHSGGNSFTYSNVQCITNNYHMVDQQFGRFTQFVESQPEVLRLELKRFYAPMLCHLYVELLKSREPKGAVDFLRKYAHFVAPVDLYDAPLPTKINGCSVPNDTHSGDTPLNAANAVSTFSIRFSREAQDTGDTELDYFMNLVQILSNCTKLETVENDPIVSHFRATKYELHTTEAVVDVLCSFLEKRGHVLIVNLLSSWIHVNIVDNELRQFAEDEIFLCMSDDGEDSDSRHELDEFANREYDHGHMNVNEKLTLKRHSEESVVKLEADIKPDPGGTTTGGTGLNVENCIKLMQTSSQQILKSQIVFPRFISLADKDRGLTSAHIDANECHMVAGFDNSVVQLWQMNQHSCTGRSFYRCVSYPKCAWELNNCHEEGREDEQEPESEDEIEARCTLDQRIRRRAAWAKKYAGNSYNEFGGIKLRGHGQGVTDVRFSDHYPLLYSVSKDSTMRAWRAHNYSCAQVYNGHDYPIWCMDESPTGMYAATGSKDLTARLWSLEREHALIIYAGHTQDVECLSFHPNGCYMATGSTDHSVRLWCITSGKLIRVFSDCKQAVSCLAFSPDGKMLAAAGEESKVRIFDLAAASQLGELRDHTACVTSLTWNREEQHLASVCNDGSFRLWDVKKLSPINENGAYNGGITSTSTSTSSSSSSSSLNTTNRLISINSSCSRLVKVLYSQRSMLYCIGSSL